MLKLKLLRIAQGRTQWQVAHQAKISSGRVSMLERGIVEPSPEELEKLAQVLRAKASTLLREVRLMKEVASAGVE